MQAHLIVATSLRKEFGNQFSNNTNHFFVINTYKNYKENLQPSAKLFFFQFVLSHSDINS